MVTEAGFAADLGAEKFFNIKCVSGGLKPEAVVIVATVRALRHHGGVKKAMLSYPDVEAVEKGLCNLDKHIENILQYGLKPIVAINAFPGDSEDEISLIQHRCSLHGVRAIVSKAFAEGGSGSEALAHEVVEQIGLGHADFRPLYNWNLPVEEKIHRIATSMYGANGVEYAPKARQGLKQISELGFDSLPVCMAKTPKSLSDDEKKLGRPSNFVITVREFELAAGAGFIVPILGDIMRMPGLPTVPAAETVDISDEGVISGLF